MQLVKGDFEKLSILDKKAGHMKGNTLGDWIKSKNCKRWLAWIVLIAVFFFLDKQKFAFYTVPLWGLLFIGTCLAFIVVLFILRD